MFSLLYLLTYLTRLFVVVLKLFGNNGTALPGLWVERYMPSLIKYYAKQYKKVILITGTNGKTTTQHALASILRDAKIPFVSNASGSNMLRGIAATLLLAGPQRSRKAVFLCEVEEGTMPRLTKQVRADIIVITNLYRDQLDAYGELHTTARYINEACKQSAHAKLVVNGDDPQLVSLVKDLTHHLITYGVATEHRKTFAYEGESQDSKKHVQATHIQINQDLTSFIEVDDCIESKNTLHTQIKFQPPGIYNVYNALAAYTVGRLIDIQPARLAASIQTVTPPFGRGEKIQVLTQGHVVTFHLFLVKNPAGFGQVWQLVQRVPDARLIVGLNDQVADGRDVSWIWDIDLERYYDQTATIKSLLFTGRRALDMALRYKYAEITSFDTTIETDIEKAIDRVISASKESVQYTLLVTYTAMNHVRHVLSEYSPISSYSST